MLATGDHRQAKRILVYGVTGSGKSTQAAALSDMTGIAWTSVDDLTWEPGWTEVSLPEQRRKIAEICAQDEWILDAAYGKWLDIPLARVELIIGLDYPRWLSLGRLVRRTALRVAARRIVCNGNRETLRGVFSHDSIFVWHFASVARKRQRIRGWESDPTGPPVLRYTRPREARKMLPGFAREC